MANSPRSVVLRFLREAEAAAGGTAGRMADGIAPYLGRRLSDKAILSWLRGERRPSAEVLVALLRAFHARGLSFDQVALDGTDQRPLIDQLDELRTLVLGLQDALNADRADRNLPPVELGGDAG